MMNILGPILGIAALLAWVYVAVVSSMGMAIASGLMKSFGQHKPSVVLSILSVNILLVCWYVGWLAMR